MIIIYTTPGGESEEYDSRTLLSSEASIVARTIDQKWAQVKEGLGAEDLDAMRGVVWVLKKRHQANLRFGEFDPGVDDMVTRCDDREIEDWVDNAFAMHVADPDITPEQIANALHEVPEAAADPDRARAYIEKKRAEAESGGKDPEAVPAPAEPAPAEPAPGPKKSAPKTSATSGTSSSGSSPTS